MTQFESTFAGQYVGGRYHVSAEVKFHEHAIVAAHEEAHGILHRSSAFGAILTAAEKLLTRHNARESAFTLHLLASGSRTSDEVHATYQSLRTAQSWKYDLNQILKQFPSYQMYYNIGQQLVGDESLEIVANAALDSIIRFCWSDAELESCELPFHDVAELNNIQRSSLPDNRFRRFRECWNAAELSKFVSGMLGEDSDSLRKLFSSNPRELADPTGHALRQIADAGELQLIIPPDSQAVMQSQNYAWTMMVSSLIERIVMRGYELLVEQFRATDLAGIPTDRLYPYLNRAREARRTGISVPEITLFRPNPVDVSLQALRPNSSRRMIFLRSREEFGNTFGIEKKEQIKSGSLVLYSPVAVFPEDTKEDVPTVLEADGIDPVDVVNMASRAGTPDLLLVVFASVVVAHHKLLWPVLERLSEEGFFVWIVGDVAPEICIQEVHPRMPEMRGFWHSSSPLNFGGLVLPQVGFAGFVEGVVFLGSRNTMEGLIVPTLSRLIGDDMRGYGSCPLFDERAVLRERMGQYLAEWLMRLEHASSF